MKKYLDLNRKFGRLSNYSAFELSSLALRTKRLSWEQILKGRYSIIVGRANFGKTTELDTKNLALRAQGRSSIIVALHRVFGENNFEDALEVAELEAFASWKQKGGKIVVFVDSLDEVALASKEGISRSLRRVCNAIGTSLDVTWVLSTRPAVLNDSVLHVVLQELRTTLYKEEEWTKEDYFNYVETDAFDETQTDLDTSGVDEGDGEAKAAVDIKVIEQDQLKIYALQPLDRVAINLYLREKVGIDQPEETILAARRYGLSRMIDSPGGLDILGYINPVKHPPQSLTEVYERISDAIWDQHRIDPREEKLDAKPQELEQALQALAAASVLCGLPNIEISEHSLEYQPGVLSARPITALMLRELSLKYLLGSPYFIDAGHHQSKFYDDLLPFLAAKHLAGLVKSPEHALQLINNFAWRAPTGECGVNKELLTMAGWLSVFSIHCRKVLLDVEPQAVAFFGDLRNAGVSLHDATAALERSINRLVEIGDSIGRHYFTLTTENYWQVMKPGMEPVLVRLYQDYGADISARQVLLDIAGNATSEVFRDIVLEAVGHDYEKLLVEEHSLDYVLSLGRQDDFDAIALALVNQSTLPVDRIARVVSYVAWRSLKAKYIAHLVINQFKSGRDIHSFDWILTQEVSENATVNELYCLIRTLILHLITREKKSGRTPVEYRSDQKFLELVLDLLGVFVARANECVNKAVRLLLVVNRFMVENFTENADQRNLHTALSANKAVRVELLRSLIRSTDKTSDGIQKKVFSYHSLYLYVKADEIEVNEPGFTALVEQWNIIEKEKQNNPVPTKRKAHVIGEDFRQLLITNLSEISEGKCDSAFYRVTRWLSNTIHNSRYSECDFAMFREAAGSEIADVVHKGLSVLWRQQDPLSNENSPSSTYNLTIAGLQGLFLDLGNGDNLPMLTKVEVQRAIRYAAFEMNDYPKWFWKLVNAYTDDAAQELLLMIVNAGRGAVSMAHTETLIRKLNEAPVEIQRLLAQPAWDFIRTTPSVGENTLKMAITIAVAHGVIEKSALESMSLHLMEEAFCNEGPSVDEFVCKTNQELLDKQQKTDDFYRLRKNAVTWGSLWLCSYPKSFSQAWHDWSVRNNKDALDFMFSLAAELGEERGARLRQVADKGSEGLEVLKQLYYWTHTFIKQEDDQERERNEDSSSTYRYHAQVLRDAIVPAISYAKSEMAYQILDDIRQSTSGATANYLRYTQFMMREDQNPRNLIEQKDYTNFERILAPKVSSYVNFAMTVENDLLAIKSQIETGDFSLRRFFNGISFDRIKTDNDGLALEDDFQSLLGSELNHACRGRYAVSLESILPGGTRRDVLCQFENFDATIELKMSARWTVSDYLEALDKQLLSQYMMAENSKIGFFVIVLQKKDRKWEMPGSKDIGFEELLALLQRKAREKSMVDSALYLRVIGIDASEKTDFRLEKKLAKGKR